MERRRVSTSGQCFLCPARIFIASEGSYFCDPAKLDDKSVVRNIAKYRPEACPNNIKPGPSGSPEMILRRILGK